MVSKTLTVKNAQGFHMRPATVFAGAMGKFDSQITLEVGQKKVDGKSVMNRIAAAVIVVGRLIAVVGGGAVVARIAAVVIGRCVILIIVGRSIVILRAAVIFCGDVVILRAAVIIL